MSELWKNREDVKRLTVGRTLLGRGIIGKVYLGRIWFKGQKPKRVAVKQFTNPRHHFNEPMNSLVPRFERVIEMLKREKLPIVKTGFVEHPDLGWVQVQELFGGDKTRSRIKDMKDPHLPDKKFGRIFSKKEHRDKLVNLIAKVMNIGCYPHSDIFSFKPTPKGPKLVISDLDAFVMAEIIREKGQQDLLKNIMRDALHRWANRMNAANLSTDEFLQELKKQVNHPLASAVIREKELELNPRSGEL
ncbi:MAG: hypothetical protein Q8R15_00225 [Candidatus Micrarchaeota archaeon]|nr:hypothetical protein [Candidatus Micrarchaeota archaeon]